MVPVFVLLLLALIFFWKLEIMAKDGVLSFHFGPFGRDLTPVQVRTIEAVDVHPIRDYMGYGWRSGSDGSIGYISSGKKGVRIVTDGNRAYVISCHRPEELVSLIKGWKRRYRT